MWTIEKFKEVYNRYKTSGLPARDFCINERITRSRFYYWLKKYRKIEKVNVSITTPDSKICNPPIEPRFIPLRLDVDRQCHTYPLKATHKKQVASSNPESFMEICYSNGTRVSLSGEKDMKLVKTLILLSR